MRNFLVIVLLTCLFWSCKSETDKPNFIFIYTDDQRFDDWKMACSTSS